MWLFLSNGFFSVVNHRDLDEHVLIRARRRKHITDTFGDENIYVLNVWREIYTAYGDERP